MEFVKLNFEGAKITSLKLNVDCQSNLDTSDIYFIFSQLGNANITFLVQIIL